MEEIIKALLLRNENAAKQAAMSSYPFVPVVKQQRKYTKQQMLAVFLRDGFIDRYSGERLYHPGFLRMLNVLLPDQFPFDAHGSLDKCHSIFWDLMPTVDHWVPIARGGPDVMENWITTSMKRNMAKGLWSLHDLGWNMHQSGELKDWDGYSAEFVKLVEKYLEQAKGSDYVMQWYRVTKGSLS